MARSSGAMGVRVCGIMMMMMMMILGAAAQAPAPSVDCQTVVLTLVDCLGYVTGTDKTPPAACCTELASVVNSTPQCLCLLFNTTFTQPIGVNVTIAQQLPSACKVQTPPTSLCASFGVPVPGPVSSPVVAPTPAKTPASSNAPTPATSPMAPSPLSTLSPSPSSPLAPGPSSTSPGPSSTSPTPTVSSSPSSTTTPTPATSNSTATPSPNSAPMIVSRSAGVAASLLLLASIFLP